MLKRTLYPGEFMWQLDDNRGAKRRRLEEPNNPTTERMIMSRRPPFSGQFTWHLDDNRDPNQLAKERNVDKRWRMASIREERRRNDEFEEAESQRRLSELAAQRYNLIIL